MLYVDLIVIFFFLGSSIYCIMNNTIIHHNQTINYHVLTTKEGIDLTIHQHLPLKNCSSASLTLVDFISLYKSSTINFTILLENVTILKIINLCVSIDITSIQKLISIRRLIFENCTIHFLASEQEEDYDFYPKNLSRWSFDHGQTDTFDQLITMINYLGPLKFDIQLSNCFQPVLSFNHFTPLDTQLIFLNITCQYFQIDEPLDMKTRTAIFLTPTLIIDTQPSPCPSEDKYQWLNFKHSHTKRVSLRTIICENRSIHLNFDINQVLIETTTRKIRRTTQTTSNQIIQLKKWTTAPLLINFSVVLVCILMLFVGFTIFLIRFYKN